MHRFAIAAVAAALALPALAATEDDGKTVSSQITEVTVYADRARVTRTASAEIAELGHWHRPHPGRSNIGPGKPASAARQPVRQRGRCVHRSIRFLRHTGGAKPRERRRRSAEAGKARTRRHRGPERCAERAAAHVRDEKGATRSGTTASPLAFGTVACDTSVVHLSRPRVLLRALLLVAGGAFLLWKAWGSHAAARAAGSGAEALLLSRMALVEGLMGILGLVAAGVAFLALRPHRRRHTLHLGDLAQSSPGEDMRRE